MTLLSVVWKDELPSLHAGQRLPGRTTGGIGPKKQSVLQNKGVAVT